MNQPNNQPTHFCIWCNNDGFVTAITKDMAERLNAAIELKPEVDYQYVFRCLCSAGQLREEVAIPMLAGAFSNSYVPYDPIYKRTLEPLPVLPVKAKPFKRPNQPVQTHALDRRSLSSERASEVDESSQQEALW